MPPTDQRAEVFSRIREALRRAAPHRHAPSPPGAIPGPGDGPPAANTFRNWLPAVGPSPDEQFALFASHCAQLRTELHILSSLDEAAGQLALLARENSWRRIATHRHALALPPAEKLALPTLITNEGYAVPDLEQCHAAITGCDALVAQTGSILVSSGSAGGRALSVLPPHHIVIAQRGQIVPDLAAALSLARERYAPGWPSFLSFITGPSRTGDIERILVLGAHGPKRLTVLIVP
ncbi:MAG TPA: lactate utilization protein [Candidatus Methylacidiphilales bacterium]|nr:lactate utilization protein [Candidatus Methylacidiphilales bacterium]